MNKITLFRFLLFTAILYQCLVIIWIHQDKITFGAGLGGLIFYYMAVFSVAFSSLFLIISFFVRRTRSKSYILFITTPISAILALYLTFSFTIGRGYDNPWNGEVFNPRSVSEMKLDHDLDSVNNVIAANPNDKNQYLVKARMCFRSGGYYQKDVIENYKIALQYNDTCVPALEELFDIYFMNGDFSSARQTCYKILEIRPDHEKGLYWKKILTRRPPKK